MNINEKQCSRIDAKKGSIVLSQNSQDSMNLITLRNGNHFKDTALNLLVSKPFIFRESDLYLGHETLTIVKVDHDSRCPEGVYCEWQGEATVTWLYKKKWIHQ